MTHENPAAATTPGTTPEALLAGEPQTLPDGGRIVFTKHRRSTVTTVLGAVVAGAVLFAGGVLTGTALGGDDTGRGPGGSQAGAFPQSRGDLPDGALPDGGTPTAFPGATSGEISAIGDGTLTLTTADGTEVTVTTSDETAVSLVDDGEVSSLAVGDAVSVTGTTEDDAVTASSILVGDVADLVGAGPKNPR
ncbi:hypothetical protein HF995_12050 [Sanguibacter hominis ATCC BAA-789]|uniref:DUF5666 domain-containing protein n=1 Tax=Sanguibacter hominis ATCC BAA-789 TaxID=1312740 RepID=A0A9X5FGZ1_9MICO|nr:hypothetical protein [Sanguibacter hominis]NKX93991.1 hypothetical protein [Sanguibacter hominis ATCC BAA-789]